MDEITAYRAAHPAPPREQQIALLPGSRKSEISHCLPMMLEAARAFPDYRITIAGAPGVEEAFYKPYLREGEDFTRDTYGLLPTARAAVVNSGTATLEAALLDCPQEAVYHVATARVLGFLKPLMFKIPYFTLVNLILNKEVIKEQVAYHFTVHDVRQELDRLLHDEPYRADMLTAYRHLRTTLGTVALSLPQFLNTGGVEAQEDEEQYGEAPE